jgi:predicted RNA-binding Zn ribbon-like protein
MKQSTAPAGRGSPFELCGGHPALDLVNTLDNRFREDGPCERLENYADLLAFMRQTKLLGAQQVRSLAVGVKPGAADRALQAAHGLRETLAAALYAAADGRAPPTAVIRTLQHHFRRADRHRELAWRAGATPSTTPAGVAWTWSRFATQAELPVWMLARAACDLMTSQGMHQLRTCGIETCRWLFLDTSKNHSRRWCSMRICGNQMKARRFQARRRVGT